MSSEIIKRTDRTPSIVSSTTAVAAASTSTSSQEYIVRAPNKTDKKFNVMKFNASFGIDFSKWAQVKMERENNLKDFKADDEMPKFGAGSEFGRDAREEARKRKYGIVSKRYKADDQPWILRLGSGKTGKRYRGIREGGVTENASYFVFTQSQDGAFEAFPIDEWYNYTPVQTYKTLNDDEAEEEFGRRDKVFNYFNIMLKKRLKNDSTGAEDGRSSGGLNSVDADEAKGKKWGSSKSRNKGLGELKISDADDWIDSSSDDDDDDDEDNDGTNKSKTAEKSKTKKQQNTKKKPNKKKKGSDNDDEDDAWEDSDDGDEEGREVDYISDASSSDSSVAGGRDDDKKDKNDLKGVEDEEAIRKMEHSDSEEEETAASKANISENAGEEVKDSVAIKSEKSSASATSSNVPVKEKKEATSSESSADSSDSDDFDNDTTFQSAMFMQDKQKGSNSKKGTKKGKSKEAPKESPKEGQSSSRSSTPTVFGNKSVRSNERPVVSRPVGLKRPLDGDLKDAAPAKKSRTESFTSSIDGISEDSIRRYLMRKPMTARELLQKFKSKKTGLTSEQMVNTITQILKRLNPDKQHVKGKMYLSIKSKA